jgi:hypothetical protein
LIDLKSAAQNAQLVDFIDEGSSYLRVPAQVLRALQGRYQDLSDFD